MKKPKARIRVAKVRSGGMYNGFWKASHGNSFMPFMYSRTLDEIMNRLEKKFKVVEKEDKS